MLELNRDGLQAFLRCGYYLLVINLKTKKYLPLRKCVGVIFFSVVAACGALGEDKAFVSSIARGKYLVEQVALCADCHTERDWKGTQNRERWLQGAKLDFKPDRLMPWVSFAPAIAGLPSFTNDELAVKYFQTGINAAGKSSSPPMPQYRFEREDAVAVVSYLRSLQLTQTK